MISYMLLAAFAALPVAAQERPEHPRDQQWIYREFHGDGQNRPTASFLAWNYMAVIFRATCGEEPETLSLYYYPEYHVIERNAVGELQADVNEPIILARGENSITLATVVNQDALLGTAEITPQLLAVLQPGDNKLEIDAINEMGEPWYVGNAEPLCRLAQRCQQN